MTRRAPALALLAGLAWGGFAVADSTLTVSAAVSLKEPLAEVARVSGAEVDLHLGGSAALAGQLLRGAPSDVFLSASPRETLRLVEAGLVDRDAVCPVAANELVVVVPQGTQPPRRLAELADARFARIAVANAQTAPLGRYTRQALAAAGLEAALEPKLIPAQHARQVADYVARGEVDAALVYATDAERFGDRMSRAFVLDASLHEPIVYQAAALDERGREFLDLVCSADGSAVFERFGFKAWSGRR